MLPYFYSHLFFSIKKNVLPKEGLSPRDLKRINEKKIIKKIENK